MPIYTLRGCTIEVPKGGRSAKATRHGEKPDTKEFAVIAEPGAPTPEVQAQWWAMGKPEWKYFVKDYDGKWKSPDELMPESDRSNFQSLSTDEQTEEQADLNEESDGQ